MSTVTFDTLELVAKLKASGISQEQSEAIVRVIVDAQDRLVTKEILDAALTPLKIDLAVLKWMMGLLMAGVLSLILKAFF
jgi:hypothetical protein